MSIRDAHNFIRKERKEYTPADVELLDKFLNEKKTENASCKVGILLNCINFNYWQYLGPVIEDMQKYMLNGHKKHFHVWTDIPKISKETIEQEIKESEDLFKKNDFFNLCKKYTDSVYLKSEIDFNFFSAALRTFSLRVDPVSDNEIRISNMMPDIPAKMLEAIKRNWYLYQLVLDSCIIHEVEPVEWPYGTLLRYSLFLKEDSLKEYDYLFYIDVDMRVVNYVGDEILGDGLTVAPHPGYALRREYIPPYEPNKNSTAFIPRPGRIVNENGKPRFEPFYAAGGFQGGRTKEFIDAMKIMDKNINTDMQNGYIAIWNDESHWNRYVFDYEQAGKSVIYLDVSYVWPDSLHEEYYYKLWGKRHQPKIITLTKNFTLQKLDADRFLNM